jgi:hypothetical protein
MYRYSCLKPREELAAARVGAEAVFGRTECDCVQEQCVVTDPPLLGLDVVIRGAPAL